MRKFINGKVPPKLVLLKCVICSRTFEDGEIFISYYNDKGELVISECSDYHDNFHTKEEKTGGWAVMERLGNKYVRHNPMAIIGGG